MKELLQWTEETYKQTTIKQQKSSESYRKFTTDTLRMFLKACDDLENFRLIFQQKILKPLKEFFNDTAANKYIIQLELLQLQWKQLLSPGAINSGQFSSGSAVYLKEAESHKSFHCYYLVLRLIPDLCFKAERCIELVKLCLDTDNSKAYERERKFMLGVWIPRQKEKARQIQQIAKLEFFDNDLKVMQEKMTSCNLKIEEQQDSLQGINDNLTKMIGSKANMKKKLENCKKEKEENNKLIEMLRTQKHCIADRMLSMKKILKTDRRNIKQSVWSRYHDGLESEEYTKLRGQVVDNLKSFEDDRRCYESIIIDIEKREMIIEILENEKVTLNYHIERTTNKSVIAEKNIELMKDELNQLIKEKRMLELEIKINFKNTENTIGSS